MNRCADVQVAKEQVTGHSMSLISRNRGRDLRGPHREPSRDRETGAGVERWVLQGRHRESGVAAGDAVEGPALRRGRHTQCPPAPGARCQGCVRQGRKQGLLEACDAHAPSSTAPRGQDTGAARVHRRAAARPHAGIHTSVTQPRERNQHQERRGAAPRTLC